jgi:hypothetical protein
VSEHNATVSTYRDLIRARIFGVFCSRAPCCISLANTGERWFTSGQDCCRWSATCPVVDSAKDLDALLLGCRAGVVARCSLVPFHDGARGLTYRRRLSSARQLAGSQRGVCPQHLGRPVQEASKGRGCPEHQRSMASQRRAEGAKLRERWPSAPGAVGAGARAGQHWQQQYVADDDEDDIEEQHRG